MRARICHTKGRKDDVKSGQRVCSVLVTFIAPRRQLWLNGVAGLAKSSGKYRFKRDDERINEFAILARKTDAHLK